MKSQTKHREMKFKKIKKTLNSYERKLIKSKRKKIKQQNNKRKITRDHKIVVKKLLKSVTIGKTLDMILQEERKQLEAQDIDNYIKETIAKDLAKVKKENPRTKVKRPRIIKPNKLGKRKQSKKKFEQLTF